MRLLTIILLLALAGLQYKLWWGDGNFFQWRALEKKLQLQGAENNNLALRNRAMETNILELKSGDQALEEQSRYELGLIKEGETYYQFGD